MKVSNRRKNAIEIANARWVLSQRVWASRKALRFTNTLSDNIAAQDRSSGQGPFLLDSATSTLGSYGPRGKFNWNLLLGVVLTAGVSTVFWVGVAIALSGVLR